MSLHTQRISSRLLLIIDPQIDFITGSLKVDGAETAMRSLASYLGVHAKDYAACVVTVDWHPPGHVSFEQNGGPWPRHCVAFSEGAAIYPGLLTSLIENVPGYMVLTKGVAGDHEEYSIFANAKSASVLEALISTKGITGIDLCGIAGDICVSDTLLDGIAIYGPSFFKVLQDYCPSLDGGLRIAALAAQLTH